VSYSEALEQQVGLWQWLRSTPSVVPKDAVEGTRQMMIGSLRDAETVFVAAHMTDFLTRSATTYPNIPLHADSLPLTSGFVFFERVIPIDVPSVWKEGDQSRRESRIVGIRALSWKSVTDPGLLDGIFVTAWGDTGNRYPWPTGVVGWNWGEGWKDFGAVDPDPDLTALTREEVRNMLLVVRRLLGTLFEFMRQRILFAPQRPVERHARKRVEREGWAHEPLVRVVELRRRERIGQPEPATANEHEWSCQWMVRGHWRQQPVGPGRGQRRALWIMPYVKGPEDKPLKQPRATIFAVVR
jgi:hypothetical protein